ncbi:MAG: DUF3999 domain-containing protein [Opitutaceae bacterium]|nr:DUF3999 domain-containing protein [Opitutaceae bacterium]
MADPDGDGLPNLLEYALAQDPLVSASLPAIRLTNRNDARLALEFLRVADPVLMYSVEASADLATWTTVWSSSGGQNLAGPVTITDAVSLSPRSWRFLRLRVTR